MTSSGKSVYRWDQERLGAALSVLVFSVGACSVLVCDAVVLPCIPCGPLAGLFSGYIFGCSSPCCNTILYTTYAGKKKQKTGEARS